MPNWNDLSTCALDSNPNPDDWVHLTIEGPNDTDNIGAYRKLSICIYRPSRFLNTRAELKSYGGQIFFYYIFFTSDPNKRYRLQVMSTSSPGFEANNRSVPGLPDGIAIEEPIQIYANRRYLDNGFIDAKEISDE